MKSLLKSFMWMSKATQPKMSQTDLITLFFRLASAYSSPTQLMDCHISQESQMQVLELELAQATKRKYHLRKSKENCTNCRRTGKQTGHVTSQSQGLKHYQDSPLCFSLPVGFIFFCFRLTPSRAVSSFTLYLETLSQLVQAAITKIP